MAGEVDELYVVNADGSGQPKLTERGHDARWSPDGEKISFVTNRDGNDEIYVTSADGSWAAERLTESAPARQRLLLVAVACPRPVPMKATSGFRTAGSIRAPGCHGRRGRVVSAVQVCGP